MSPGQTDIIRSNQQQISVLVQSLVYDHVAAHRRRHHVLCRRLQSQQMLYKCSLAFQYKQLLPWRIKTRVQCPIFQTSYGYLKIFPLSSSQVYLKFVIAPRYGLYEQRQLFNPSCHWVQRQSSVAYLYYHAGVCSCSCCSTKSIDIKSHLSTWLINKHTRFAHCRAKLSGTGHMQAMQHNRQLSKLAVRVPSKTCFAFPLSILLWPPNNTPRQPHPYPHPIVRFPFSSLNRFLPQFVRQAHSTDLSRIQTHYTPCPEKLEPLAL